jgi:glycosyltransferase involved in cell wall biosynthesis
MHSQGSALNTNIDLPPLRIGLLSYRSHPHCGGQGVYVRNLSHALCQLGHQVEVISGPPYPELDNGARLHRLPSLDLYNPDDLFRTPAIDELLDPINLLEWISVSTMGFPEPLTFGMRARKLVQSLRGRFDILHDNQSLSYGIRALARDIPTVATIHHAITVDRRLAVRAERSILKKMKHLRWYSFIQMQKRVAPALNRLITVSQCAKQDIVREFGLEPSKFSVIPNGIDTDRFYPLKGVERKPFRLIVTTSADTPLKGLQYLLRAVAKLIPKWPKLHLMVVGRPKKNSPILRQIDRLGLTRHIQFTGAISHTQFVRHYARAWCAVVPSLYEGFGLPAGEAMACGVPVVSTSGGALPEVVADAGIVVPPADHRALAKAIETLCADPILAQTLGRAGYERVMNHFTWKVAAQKCVNVYRRVIDDYR